MAVSSLRWRSCPTCPRCCSVPVRKIWLRRITSFGSAVATTWRACSRPRISWCPVRASAKDSRTCLPKEWHAGFRRLQPMSAMRSSSSATRGSWCRPKAPMRSLLLSGHWLPNQQRRGRNAGARLARALWRILRCHAPSSGMWTFTKRSAHSPAEACQFPSTRHFKWRAGCGKRSRQFRLRRRRGRPDPPGQSELGHPFVRGLPGRGLALPRQPSSLAAQADEMVSPAHGLRPAVFLDRDGVIVVPEFRDGRSFAPRRLEVFRLYPDAAASLQKLKQAGFLLAVVTNQPDAGDGLIAHSEVNAMHEIMARQLPLDAVKACFHGHGEACDCRKPKPGMILETATELGINLTKSFMVGDRKSDIKAGRGLTAQEGPGAGSPISRSRFSPTELTMTASSKCRKIPRSRASPLIRR